MIDPAVVESPFAFHRALREQAPVYVPEVIAAMSKGYPPVDRAFATLRGGTRELRLSPGKNDFAHVPSFSPRGSKQLFEDVVPA